MFNSILTVCVGNICRSPAAQLLLQHQLPAKQVSSGGLGALAGRGMEAHAARLVEAEGIDTSGHVARQLDQQMTAASDLILVMESWQIGAVCDIDASARGKTMMLGKWLDNREIPDPYRKSAEMFVQVHGLIVRACTGWTDRL